VTSIIEDLKSRINAAYLDNESLADEAAVVAADVTEVLSEAAAIGLELNQAKFELYVLDNPEALAEIYHLLPGIQTLEPSELHLLGAPLTVEALPAGDLPTDYRS